MTNEGVQPRITSSHIISLPLSISPSDYHCRSESKSAMKTAVSVCLPSYAVPGPDSSPTRRSSMNGRTSAHRPSFLRPQRTRTSFCTTIIPSRYSPSIILNSSTRPCSYAVNSVLQRRETASKSECRSSAFRSAFFHASKNGEFCVSQLFQQFKDGAKKAAHLMDLCNSQRYTFMRDLSRSPEFFVRGLETT